MLLADIRNTLLGTTCKNPRCDVLRKVSGVNIYNALAIVDGFGAARIARNSNDKIGAIKTLRRLATDDIALIDAKNLIELLADACEFGGSEDLLKEYATLIPWRQAS